MQQITDFPGWFRVQSGSRKVTGRPPVCEVLGTLSAPALLGQEHPSVIGIVGRCCPAILFIRHWRRLGNFLPRRRAPYLAFVATYRLLFIIAFSNFGNFGILARQRAQLLPFVLVLLAIDRRDVKATDTEGATPSPLPRHQGRRTPRPLASAAPVQDRGNEKHGPGCCTSSQESAFR